MAKIEEETTKKSAAVKKNDSKLIKDTRTAYMYLGPNLKKGLLYFGALFQGKRPIYIDELIKKMPELNRFFVEVSEVQSFKAELLNKNSEISILYNEILEKINGGENIGV